MDTSEPNKPIKTFRRRNIRIAIWENRVEQDDETRIRQSAGIRKRYRDKNGDWHDTDVWFPEDLLRLAELAREAAKCMEQTEETPAAADAPATDTEDVPI